MGNRYLTSPNFMGLELKNEACYDTVRWNTIFSYGYNEIINIFNKAVGFIHPRKMKQSLLVF
eukprot:snap_masked-scaffold_3-processed-gene-16.59-mRNA-1 protein AED:1.00 eAED:1.00 QI:0/0/0/0/1/1/2/0/61